MDEMTDSLVDSIDIPVQDDGLFTIRCCATVQVEGYKENVLVYPGNNGKDEKGKYEIYKVERYGSFYTGYYYTIWKRYTYQMVFYKETNVPAGENAQAVISLPISEEYLESITSVPGRLPMRQ